VLHEFRSTLSHKNVWDYTTNITVAAYWRLGATGTNARGTGPGIDSSRGRTLVRVLIALGLFGSWRAQALLNLRQSKAGVRGAQLMTITHARGFLIFAARQFPWMAPRVATAACHAHDLARANAGGGHCRPGIRVRALVFFSAGLESIPDLYRRTFSVYIGAVRRKRPWRR